MTESLMEISMSNAPTAELELSDNSVERSVKRRKTADFAEQSGDPGLPQITINVGPKGTLHVWDPEDAVIVQSLYHVMGTAAGCFAKTPLQDIFKSLPLRLTPAEAAYLRDIKAARFVDEALLLKHPSLTDQFAFQEERAKQFSEQHSEFDKERQLLLDQRKDDILIGRIKKMRTEAEANGVTLPEDKEELWNVIRAELLGRPMVREGSARIELPFRSWKVEFGLSKLEEIPFNYPETHADRVYYAAYSTLMKGGFWLTSGMKYGGDLLLYEGDVHVNHSTCIVKIVDEDEEISLEEILRIGRVATSCHKAVLWASVRKDYTVDFTCSKWALMK